MAFLSTVAVPRASNITFTLRDLGVSFALSVTIFIVIGSLWVSIFSLVFLNRRLRSHLTNRVDGPLALRACAASYLFL